MLKGECQDCRPLECDKCTAKGLPSQGCPRCRGHGHLWGNTPLVEMGKLAKRRKHHTIPKWYQKNFANDDGHVHYWKKGDQPVLRKHPAAIFYERDAYNAFDSDGNLMVESETVFAYLDGKACQDVAETVRAYEIAAKMGCRDFRVPRMGLEVLVTGLITRGTGFREEGVERYRKKRDDEGRRLGDYLARATVVKHLADLAQMGYQKLAAAALVIAGCGEGEELIYGDGDGSWHLARFANSPTGTATVRDGCMPSVIHGLRAYDCVQLAAALACEDMVGALGVDVVLATFDRQLRKAAARSGLSTWPQ